MLVTANKRRQRSDDSLTTQELHSNEERRKHLLPQGQVVLVSVGVVDLVRLVGSRSEAIQGQSLLVARGNELVASVGLYDSTAKGTLARAKKQHGRGQGLLGGELGGRREHLLRDN